MTSRNVIAVVLWMAGTLVSFSALAVGIRSLSDRLGVLDMLALRNAAGIAILLALAALRPGLRRDLALRRPALHVARNLVHFAATYAWALALTLMPLATAFALEFTTPAWVGLLAVLVLKERMTASRLASIVLGFAGMLVILRPGLGTLQGGALVMLGAALGFGITTITTKMLTTTESTVAILFWMNLMQLPLNLLGSSPAAWTGIDGSMALPLAAVCLGGFLAHVCLTNAYREGDAIMVVPLDFLRIPLIALIGWQLYAEQLDPLVFAGAGLIIAGVLWNLRAEARG